VFLVPSFSQIPWSWRPRWQSGSSLLPRRMLSPLSIQNTLAGSNLIRYSYAGLSPHSLRLFLLMSSASPHLMICDALWSEYLCHSPKLECSNSNTSCTPSRWAPLLCQSISSLSSPSWTTWRQSLIQLSTLTSSPPCSVVCLPSMTRSSPPSTHKPTLYCQKNTSASCLARRFIVGLLSLHQTPQPSSFLLLWFILSPTLQAIIRL